ncbi:hypothetical protein AK812_SmicGene26217 [Symbiodinium microadriaticum]|uniref:Uncharacterized protein n=1 Tax=Symbiodinium microadriaticum TaxID=2951 RepID=A0A1Q9DA29_SYMMI|nr:hypothetical protein AK812_SmicGene26217 [Symbiodinium microadriaticum]
MTWRAAWHAELASPAVGEAEAANSVVMVFHDADSEQIEQLEAENQRLKAKLEDESSRHAVQTEELEASHRDALAAAAEQLESQRVAYVTQMEDMRQNLDSQYRQEQDALKAQEQEQNQRFQEELQQLRDREAAQRKRHEEQMMEFRGREEERQRKFQEDLGEALRDSNKADLEKRLLEEQVHDSQETRCPYSERKNPSILKLQTFEA